MITPAQCKAARKLLNLSMQNLAHCARISLSSVKRFEGGGESTRRGVVEDLQSALERAGVSFAGGSAVLKRDDSNGRL